MPPFKDDLESILPTRQNLPPQTSDRIHFHSFPHSFIPIFQKRQRNALLIHSRESHTCDPLRQPPDPHRHPPVLSLHNR